MTGCLEVSNVSSCCCCELCQPVRCIIDQHEVEIVPATYRSSNSSLAPTTHRSQWSTSSNNTLPSSRNLVNEDSIVDPRTRRTIPPKLTAKHAATGNTHSLSKAGCPHSTRKQGQTASESRNRHVPGAAANVALVHQDKHQSNTEVSARTCGQKSVTSHCLPRASKQLPLENDPAAREKGKENRVKTATAKNSAAISRTCTSQGVGCDRPFHLFEQDPQHLAPFPDGSPVNHAEQHARRARLGAAIASALTPPREQMPGARVEFQCVTDEGHGCRGRLEREPSNDASFSFIVNQSRNGSDRRDCCGVSGFVPSVPGTNGLQSFQNSRVELRDPHVWQDSAVRHKGQEHGLLPRAIRKTNDVSACSFATTFRADRSTHTPSNRDMAFLMRTSTDRHLYDEHHCIVKRRRTHDEDGGGSVHFGSTAEGDAEDASAGETATMKKSRAGRHALVNSFLRARRESTTTTMGVVAAGMEPRARAHTSLLRLDRMSQMVGSLINTTGAPNLTTAYDTSSRRAISCPGRTGHEKRSAHVQTGALRKGDTNISPHNLQADDVTSSSGRGPAGGSTRTRTATCLRRPTACQMKKNPGNSGFRSQGEDRRSGASFTKSELFFYDSSFSCADGFACCSGLNATDERSIAADDKSVADAAGPNKLLQTNTRGQTDPHDSVERGYLLRTRRLSYKHKGTHGCIQHAGFAHVPLTTTGVASTTGCISSIRKAFGAHERAPSETWQEGIKNRPIGSPRAPRELGGTAVSDAGRREQCGWQRHDRVCPAAHDAHTWFWKRKQQNQGRQQPQLDCAAPSDSRQNLSTPERMALIAPLPKMYPETISTIKLHDRRLPTKHSPVELSTQKCTASPSILLQSAYVQTCSASNKVLEQTCGSRTHAQRQQLPEPGFEISTRTASTATGAECDDYADTGDNGHLSCIQKTSTRKTSHNALLIEDMTYDGHRYSNPVTLCTLRRLRRSNASTQWTEVPFESLRGQACFRACRGVTHSIQPLSVSSNVCLSPGAAVQKNPAQHQRKQPVCSKVHPRRTASQQQRETATKSSDVRHIRCASRAQSGEALSSKVVPEEVAGPMKSGGDSSSPVSTDVPRAPIRPQSHPYLPPPTPLKADSQGTTDQDGSWIVSGLSTSNNRSRHCNIRATSTTDSITSEWSDNMPTLITKSRGTTRDNTASKSKGLSMIRTEGGDRGDCTVRGGSRIRRSELSKSRGVCRSVKVHLKDSSAEMPEAPCPEIGCTCPIVFDKHSSCDVGKACSRQFMLEALGSYQVVEPGTTRSYPWTAARCLGGSRLRPSLSTQKMIFTFYKDADVVPSLEQNILLSTFDKNALLPRGRARVQKPREEDNAETRKSRLYLTSKVKCIGKELRSAFLTKAARLALWQAGTHIVPAAPPIKPLVS